MEEEHNAPFQSSKPFFSSSEKPPLYSFSLFPYFSRLLYTAKSSRACFLSWEDGNQTEGRHGMRRGGETDCRIVRVEFQVTEARLIALL